MRYHMTVLGAGSMLGRCLCHRAVRLGWEVNAFSVFPIRPALEIRKRIFYRDPHLWEEQATQNNTHTLNFEFNFLCFVLLIFEKITIKKGIKTKEN